LDLLWHIWLSSIKKAAAAVDAAAEIVHLIRTALVTINKTTGGIEQSPKNKSDKLAMANSAMK